MNENVENDLLGNFGGTQANSLNALLNINDESDDDNVSYFYQDSPYYDIDSIKIFCERNKHSFSVFSLNSQSINAKINELICVLQKIKDDCDFLFSAICIQESWVGENQSVEHLEIENYELFNKPRSIGPKSGMIIYLRDDYIGDDKKTIFKVPDSRLWEGQSILVSGGDLSNQIRLSHIYRPPRFNNNNSSVEIFLKEISPYLDEFCKNNQTHLIAGDFNIDLKEMKNREKYQNYFDKFVSSGFLPKITLPTRFSKKKCTIIDQIFCKFQNLDTRNESGVFITDISDHFPCITAFQTSDKQVNCKKIVTYTEKSPKNIQIFLGKVAADIEKIHFNNDEKANPYETFGKLDKCIADNFTLSFPEKQARFNKYRHKISPWITNGILKSIHRRDNLAKKIKNTPYNNSKYEELCTNLKVLRQSLRSLIREAKKMYYYAEFQKFSGDCKRTWNKISEVLNRNRKKSKFPEFFKIDIKQNSLLNGKKVEKTTSIKISDKKQLLISLMFTLQILAQTYQMKNETQIM